MRATKKVETKDSPADVTASSPDQKTLLAARAIKPKFAFACGQDLSLINGLGESERPYVAM
jgi:hypothetical protein